MARLLLLLLAEGALAWGVHHLSTARLAPVLADPAALATATTGDLLVALVHAAAAVACWWLLLGTAHDAVVVVRSPRGSARRGRRVAPRWAQRVIEQAVGAALAVGVAAGPAVPAAAAQPARAVAAVAAVEAVGAPPVVAPPVPVVPGPAAVEPPAPSTPPGGGEGSDGPSADPPGAAPVAGAADGGDRSAGAHDAAGGGSGDRAEHVVAAGENLWVIARQHLAAAQPGSPPTDRQVHACWVRLIAANQDRLRSGDPDLVFPGEVLALPPAADLPGSP